MTILMSNPVGLEHQMPPGHPEQIARLERVFDILEGPEFAALDRRSAPMAEQDDVALAHPRSYIEQIWKKAPSEGLIALDPDTSMSPATWVAG